MSSCKESVIYRRLTDAVELLANKGDFDPLFGFVDICAQERIVTLPREVETIIALNLGGTPAVGRDSLFTFHLNGPGDDCPVTDKSWQDLGDAPTYREIECPAKLIAEAVDESDAGTELWVYGQNKHGETIRTLIDGVWFDGFPVPVFHGISAPGEDAPEFARIVRIRKEPTNGPIRLSTIDNDSGSGTLIGIFEHDETSPLYRRIKLSKKADWVRIAYRKRVFKLSTQHDRIPLHNAQAVIMMLRALIQYDELSFENAINCESTALRWLEEEQMTRTPPVQFPLQVGSPTLMDHSDDVV
jgi:hypothetical protein